MNKDYVTVKETFEISNRGTGVVPEESLPPEIFGKRYVVQVEQPDSTYLEFTASVESMLLSASKGIEVFTYLLHGAYNLNLKPGIKIKQLRQLQ